MENNTQLNMMLDRYEIFTPLDKRNKVFLVKDNDTNEICVQKHSTVVDQDLYMFLKDHPVEGVPTIYDIIRCSDNELVLIEEYVHGNNLEQLISKNELLTENEVVNYITQLCHILKQFHEMDPKIIHRDIKPSNIIVSNESTIYLIDFNTSRTYKPGEGLDTTAFVTQHFSAPELYGFGQSDQRSDIYSIGATMHYLLTGGFLHESVYQGDLESIINKCTTMAPKDRYQSVDELVLDLEKFSQVSFTIENNMPENIISKESDCHESAFSRNQDEMIKGITLSGSYAIPGFRTKRWWKMILAVLGYFLIADVCFTMDIKSGVNPPLDIIDVWLERICTFIFFIASIFMIFNYKNCQSVLPFGKKTNSRLLTVSVGIFLTFAILIAFLVLEVNILGIF